MTSLKTVPALLVSVFVLIAAVATASTGTLTQAESSLLGAVNQARIDHGLQPLRPDQTLERAARAHSADMIRNRYFAHGAFMQRLSAFGARGRILGENLAWGTGTDARATTILAAWLASPEHRANLLRAAFQRIGIGALRGTFQGNGDALVITADFSGG
ncbi:MAG: CAP domain-containing protein [Gaiellaceae bacterium]